MEYSLTVRGRRLIREIERLRHASGLSMETAAQRLGWSSSKLYRLENGRSKITTDDLADMLDLYGVRSRATVYRSAIAGMMPTLRFGSPITSSRCSSCAAITCGVPRRVRSTCSASTTMNRRRPLDSTF